MMNILRLFNSYFKKPFSASGIQPKVVLLLAFSAVLASGLVAQTTFTTSGTYTVPAGVTSLKIECWGGGGAGGGCPKDNNNTGGGGAGGAFKTATVAVTPGQVINYTVGAGGVPVSGGNGGNGGNSTFLTVTANGGQGGTAGIGPNGIGIGGATTIGDFNGGAGANGVPASPSNGGPGGGGAGNGGSGAAGSGITGGAGGTGAIPGGAGANGPVILETNGFAATSLSGGGSGALNGNGSASSVLSGGAGFRGQITIYTCVLELTSTTATSPICVGGTSTITLNGTAARLPTGTYTVTYNLSAPNSASGLTATMTVATAGTGTFTSGVLANAGATTITITNLDNGSCSSPQSINNTAIIDVLADPTAPTLNVATPANGSTVCVGQDLSATFNAGSGGTGCADEFQYSTNGGNSYNPYTPGTVIPTSGLAGQTVIIQGRRLCSGNGCDGAGETFATLANWTVVADPTAPTLNVASPANGTTVCVGQDLSATFNAGSGGTGCADEYQYSTDGGGNYNPYTPGTAIPTLGLAGQTVIIQGRRLCSGNGCDGAAETYATLASWTVVADPTAPTLNVATPANGSTVCVGQDLSATFNAGSGGTGCADEYQYSTNGGTNYISYTPGTAILSTGLVGQTVIIQGRRLCSGNGCDGAAETYATLASWTVVADPAAPTATKSPNVPAVCAGTMLTVTDVTDNGGGTGNCILEYAHNGGAWTSTLTPFAAVVGVNTIEIRKNCDGAGCGTSVVSTYSWTGNALPTGGTCNLVGDYCYTNSGKIDIQASGGTAPYNVTWTPAHGLSQPQVIGTSGGIITITGLHANTNYTFTILDANGCQAP